MYVKIARSTHLTVRHNSSSHDGHVALSNNIRILERARLLRAGRRPYDATLEQCEKFNL